MRVVKDDGSIHGVLNWFSIHTTSMNMSNHLISSDNLGYAALRMEQELNPGVLPGKVKKITTVIHVYDICVKNYETPKSVWFGFVTYS